MQISFMTKLNDKLLHLSFGCNLVIFLLKGNILHSLKKNIKIVE